ncbi:MAG TPA: hypothetical protein DEP35_00330 [Deltaproteobacteria bacterium]|nr:hypothetical protein [Deltaproteobacteria bacterium]
MASAASICALRCLALAALCAALGALLPAETVAQGMRSHPLPKGPRPLHEIAASADAIAIGTIASVSEGRIRVHDAIDVSGAVPADFDVKRAPSNPPVFQSGDRALLFLRGARPPYLLTDDPKENLVIPASGEVQWILAMRAFADARHDPAQLRTLYFEWIDGEDGTLRDLGVRGLADPAAPFQPISTDLLTERARRAVDPATASEVRRACASVALLSAESYARLLRDVLQPGTAVDAGVYETALQGALLQHGDPPEFSAALGRGLRSGEAAVRAVAVRYATNVPDPGLANEVERLAQQDPDPGVRQAAARALATQRER